MFRIVILAFLLTVASGAVISNEVTETPRIHDGEELISVIMRDCFDLNGMSCLKGKVLTFLDTVLELKSENARSFNAQNLDKTIYERVSRILSTKEIRVELPKILFGDVVASYQSDRGIDFIVKHKSEARGLLKKKLLFPVLLLLKLKMKALMPIFVAIIGLKAIKALVLSKLAITIVLGFIIAQLVMKTGLKMPMMSMMPATDSMNSYPSTPATPDTSYGAAAWEPASGSSSSYSLRNYEPSSASSSQNLAYSSYYPSSSSSFSGPTLSTSSSSSSSSGTAQAQAY